MDKAVRGFKVFGDNAAIYAAYIMATLEWGRMYRHYGGRDTVPVLPEWLTTYIGVTKSLTTNADLPWKHVHIGNPDVRLNSVVTWQWMADLLQFWTNLSGPRLFGSIFCYPSVLAEQLMTDINPSFNASRQVTWQRIVTNTPSWLNARALFDRSQQAEFDRQQKCHANLNDLKQASECLYESSLEAEAHRDEKRAKAETDSAWLPLERQLAWKQWQEQAKVTGIAMPSTDDSKYPLWHHQPQRKTPGPNVPQPYATPKEMSAAGCDTIINKELSLENVYDPLQLRNASPTLGLRAPPAYGEDTAAIPPICIPTPGGSGHSGIGGLASGMASPVTKHDDRLLDGLPPGSPMEVGLSRGLGSGRGSSCTKPMSLGSPTLPGAGRGGVLKRLVESTSNPTAFADAMRRMQNETERKQLEEEESPYPAAQEDDPDWM